MSPCCQTPYLARIEKIKENQTAYQTIHLDPAHTQAYQVSQTVPVSTAQMPISQLPTSRMPAENASGTFPTLPRDNMTPVVKPVLPPEDPSMPTNPNVMPIPPGGTPQTELVSGIFENPPSFAVPPNPLLPPGYQEVLDYNSLQYLNGFYRTQIGHYVRVDQQVTSSEIETRFGYLIGVGINYILLQDRTTGNVFAIDSYSIKYFYVYYNVDSAYLPSPYETGE